MYLVLNSWLKSIFLGDILTMLIYFCYMFETCFAPIHDTAQANVLVI